MTQNFHPCRPPLQLAHCISQRSFARGVDIESNDTVDATRDMNGVGEIIGRSRICAVGVAL
jgi:hypothetical protein